MIIAPVRFSDAGAFLLLKAVLLSVSLHLAVILIVFAMAKQSDFSFQPIGVQERSSGRKVLLAVFEQKRIELDKDAKVASGADLKHFSRGFDRRGGKPRSGQSKLDSKVELHFKGAKNAEASENTLPSGSVDSLVRYRLALAQALRKEMGNARFAINSDYRGQIEIRHNVNGAAPVWQVNDGEPDEDRKEFRRLIARVLLDVSVPPDLLVVGREYPLEFKADGG